MVRIAQSRIGCKMRADKDPHTSDPRRGAQCRSRTRRSCFAARRTSRSPISSSRPRITSACSGFIANTSAGRRRSSRSSAVTASRSCCAWCHARADQPEREAGRHWDAFFWVRDAQRCTPTAGQGSGDRLRADRPGRVPDGGVRGARPRGYVLGFGQPLAATGGLPAEARSRAPLSTYSPLPSPVSPPRSDAGGL